jgi:hypothetical protein
VNRERLIKIIFKVYLNQTLIGLLKFGKDYKQYLCPYLRSNKKTDMKNLFLLSFIFALAFNASAQNTTTDKNFTLLVNGKQFHSGDAVSKADLNAAGGTSIQIMDKANKKYQPTSYRWAISVKDSSNGIWYGTSCTNPPDKNNETCNGLVRALKKASAGDIVFLDEFKFATAEANLPGQFSFVLR